MRRMLDITDINSVAGKKLYLHEVKFSYSSAPLGPDITGNYFAWFLSPKNVSLSAEEDLEIFRANSIFLYGNKDVDPNMQIVMIPDGNNNLIFGVLNLNNIQSPTLLADINEDFTIVSDTVTEWN